MDRKTPKKVDRKRFVRYKKGNHDNKGNNSESAGEVQSAEETEEVHHKKPLREGGTHDRSNLIALCKSCHSQIHAHRGITGGIAEGRGWSNLYR